MPARIVCYAWLLAVTPPAGSAVEDTVVSAVEWLRLGIDVIGALVIGVGVLVAVSSLAVDPARRPLDFTSTRLRLARFLALALEFQLGADILSTAVAPSWDQIGKLGAIAVIRTTLNYFLIRELREAGEMPNSKVRA
jgi:uncharacterized membrane protein